MCSSPRWKAGGHNVYGGAIPGFLKGVGKEMWGTVCADEEDCAAKFEWCLDEPEGNLRGQRDK